MHFGANGLGMPIKMGMHRSLGDDQVAGAVLTAATRCKKWKQAEEGSKHFGQQLMHMFRAGHSHGVPPNGFPSRVRVSTLSVPEVS